MGLRRQNPAARAFRDGPVADWRLVLGVNAVAVSSYYIAETPKNRFCAAVLISPTTLLPAGISLTETDVVFVNALAPSYGEKATVASGYYGNVDEDFINTGGLRQHSSPGIRDLSSREAGFGPLIYYGGALLSSVRGAECIVSYSGQRTPAAESAWTKLSEVGLARREVHTILMPVEYQQFVSVSDVDLTPLLNSVLDRDARDRRKRDGREQYGAVFLDLEIPPELVEPLFRHALDPDFKRGFEGADSLQETFIPSDPLRVSVAIGRKSPSGPVEVVGYSADSYKIGYFYERQEDVETYVDTMRGQDVVSRSGLVLWMNDELSRTWGSDFRPPPPEVLGHMNPRATNERRFFDMLTFCAKHSGDPTTYLKTVSHTLAMTQASVGMTERGSPMRAALAAIERRGVGTVGRVNGSGALSLSEWLRRTQVPWI